MFYPRQLRLGRTEPLAGTLRLSATDAGSVDLGEGQPLLAMRGTAAELLLTLWKRRPADDPAIAELLAAAVTP